MQQRERKKMKVKDEKEVPTVMTASECDILDLKDINQKFYIEYAIFI